jgi:aromatic ring hydroxylase
VSPTTGERVGLSFLTPRTSQVLVPWERVFLLGDVELCNNMSIAICQYVHSGHQVATKNVGKCEFILERFPLG